MENQPSRKKGQGFVIGIAIGLPLGIPIGLAMGNLAVGPAIGLAIGAGLGAAFEQAYRNREEVETPELLKKRKQQRLLFVGLFLIGLLLFAGIYLLLDSNR